MLRKKLFLGAVLLVAICLLIGLRCGPNQLKDSAVSNGSVTGFWLGLWHGPDLALYLLHFAVQRKRKHLRNSQ